MAPRSAGGPDDLIGQVLQDTYRVDRLIGTGGMGVVFGASHVRLTRRYAVKLLNPAVVASDEALRRFQQEAEITGSLGHPHVLEVFDFNYTPDGTPYIVMELLEGETLAARISRLGRLDFHQVMSIFEQAASALHAVHEKGIIHRDLKPENIFLCRRDGQDDFVKVVDFGISKILGRGINLTGTHALLGSPYYMAPEQAEQRSADMDVRTDVYGMGVIVYMMLAGRPPFEAGSLPALLYKVVNEAPPAPRATRPDIPEGAEDAVLAALRKDPKARHQTIEEFWQAFRRAVMDESMGATVAPSRPGNAPPRRTGTGPGDLGLRVGNYVIKRQLGEGGMGVVYLAEHPEIGREVAIKILAAHLLQYPMAAERFVAEARAVTRIKHANIIDIFDFGRLEDGRLYYIMELLEGRELKDVMAERGPMTPADVLPYLEQICAALQAAHGQGVIHRDLKPENIFQLSRASLGIKVLDFGIAKLLEPEGRAKGMTSTGMVMGSPLTMAPEQAAGMPEKIGPHTDLYSLGVVLYWMLAGLPPFSAEASGLLLAKHITERPPPLRDVAPDVPPAVATVVDRCLEKEPARRPESAAALLHSFAAAIESSQGWQAEPELPTRPKESTGKKPPTQTTLRVASGQLVPTASSKRPLVLLLGLAVPLLLGAMVVVLMLRGGSSGEEPASAPAAAATPTPSAPPGPAPAKTPEVSAPAKVRVTLKLNPADATLFVDGARREGRRIELTRGSTYALRVEADGYEPVTRELVAHADEQLTVTLGPKRAARVGPTKDRRPPARTPARPAPPVPALSQNPAPPAPPPETTPQPGPKPKPRLRFNDLDDGKKVEKPRFRDSL